MKYLKSILIIAGIVLVSSCKQDKVTAFSAECPDIISYSEKIEPLIMTNCSTSGCHDAAAPGKPALTNYNEVSANASTILSVIRHETTPMPLGAPKLADSLINQFSCWLEQGAMDN